MARETIFTVETHLWHPLSGWQTFPAGERNPGGAWYEIENGDVAQAQGPSAANLTALAEVTARAEAAERKLSDRQSDLDNAAQARDDANAKVEGLIRKAAEAEQALAAAIEDKARYAEERDRAIGNETMTAQENARLKAEVETFKGLAQEYETDLANLKAKVAAFDGDGDGEPGGRRKKPVAEPATL